MWPAALVMLVFLVGGALAAVAPFVVQSKAPRTPHASSAGVTVFTERSEPRRTLA